MAAAAGHDAVSQLQIKVDCHRRLRTINPDGRLDDFKDALRQALESK